MGISGSVAGQPVARALERARERGLLTVALSGGTGGDRDLGPGVADFNFVVLSDDAMVVQEVHETLYHVLWELVHVFFEQRVVG